MNIQWNAQDYAKHFQFVHQYGEDVLQLIDAPAGSLAVDLGCGNGALSAKLQERGYHVLGIDSSDTMLKIARQTYPSLFFHLADAKTFTLQEKADVIFSNAVFHWIDEADQDQLLRNIAVQLKKGGQLVCEFGGKGCAKMVHTALEASFFRHGLIYPRVFYFPSIGEYTPRMERHGLKVTFAALFDRWTEQETKDGLADWIRMFIRKPFEGLNPTLSQQIIQEVTEALRPSLYQNGHWYIDYVRIRLKAIRE